MFKRGCEEDRIRQRTTSSGYTESSDNKSEKDTSNKSRIDKDAEDDDEEPKCWSAESDDVLNSAY